jgi:hypothetical protein
MATIPRVFEEHMIERVTASDHMLGKCTHAGAKGKETTTHIFGDSFCVEKNKYVTICRIINRDVKIYLETFTDKETRDVFYYMDEPLRDHKGHGSAKYALRNKNKK